MSRKKTTEVTAPDAPRDIAVEEISDGETDDAAGEVLVTGGYAPGISESEVADRLVHEHGQDFRFLTDRGIVFAFVSGIWQPDTGDRHGLTHELYRCARRVCLAVHAESRLPRDVKAILKTAKFPADVVQIAVSEIEHVRFADVFDQNPDLLGLPHGRVCDLRTEIVSAARPEDFLSKSALCLPDASKSPTRFLEFINEISDGDPEWAEYILTLLGYLLTGHVRERYLGFWTGITSNGKSVLAALLDKLMGDYAVALPLKQLAAGVNTNADDELRVMAHICGARAVFASESATSYKLDIGLLKRLSAQERLTGRFLRENMFDFAPTAKTIISAQAITFEQVDAAMQVRLHVTPFRRNFAKPEDKHRFAISYPADLDLDRKLDAELPAILALLIHRASLWYQTGLKKPPVIAAATDTFFRDVDTWGQWIDQRIARDDVAAFTANNAVLSDYSQFAQETGDASEPMTQAQLSKKLKAAGFRAGKSCHVRGFFGLRLKEQDEDKSDAD